MIGRDISKDRRISKVNPPRVHAGTNSRDAWSARYRTLATVCLNTGLAGLVVLAGLHLLFPLEAFIWDQKLGGKRLSETFVAAHYYLSDPEETAAIFQDWDQYVLNGHWQVHPWTGLINREFKGRYVSVGRYGRRGGLAPDDTHASLLSDVVWVFDGSTVFGWGLSDSSTIPSLLLKPNQFSETAIRHRVGTSASPRVLDRTHATLNRTNGSDMRSKLDVNSNCPSGALWVESIRSHKFCDRCS